MKLKALLPAVLSNVVFLTILLVSYGDLSYWPAWIYFGMGLLMAVLTRRILHRTPELENERAKPGPGVKGWDKKLLGFGFLSTLATLVVAGLDAGRYHWEPVLSWPWSLAGLFLNLAGMGVFLAALKENRFFSSVVRIQSDRGQTVCDSGIYRIVRHPGYTGMILGNLGLPMLFMSAWSAIPALLFIVLMVVRTHLEDSTLANELDGYREYQRVTRHRLVPGVW